MTRNIKGITSTDNIHFFVPGILKEEDIDKLPFTSIEDFAYTYPDGAYCYVKEFTNPFHLSDIFTYHRIVAVCKDARGKANGEFQGMLDIWERNNLQWNVNYKWSYQHFGWDQACRTFADKKLMQRKKEMGTWGQVYFTDISVLNYDIEKFGVLQNPLKYVQDTVIDDKFSRDSMLEKFKQKLIELSKEGVL